jgi:hypothetical protein
MEAGRIDEFLSVIYKEVIGKTEITSEIAKKLPEIIHTYKIECDNPNIRKIIVVHKELRGEKDIRLFGGVAYVQLFTQDAVILFEDHFGKRYVSSVDFHKEKLFFEEGLVKFCIEHCFAHPYLLLSYARHILKHAKDTAKVLTILKNTIEKEEYTKEYTKAVMQDVVDYYYENYDDECLDEYLIVFDKGKMNSHTRRKILELMIMRGMYNEAYSVFSKYGNERTDAGKILKFCSRILETKSGEEDPVILHLAMYAFKIRNIMRLL